MCGFLFAAPGALWLIWVLVSVTDFADEQEHPNCSNLHSTARWIAKGC
ncbi:hypothetical protein [Kitasatospora purpeofusca]